MERPPPTLLATLLPPVGTGLGYAAAKAVGQGSAWGGLYWQSPFMFSFLSGLLIAVALRPILSRVPWQRGTAFALVLALFLAVGPPAAWSESRLVAALGLMGFPYALPRDVLPELLAAWVAGGLLAWLYCPRGGEIGLANLGRRLGRMSAGHWVARLAALGGVVALISVGLGLADSQLVRDSAMPPLFPVNPWLRAGLSGAESAGNGAAGPWAGAPLAGTGGAMLLLISWAKGLALALALLPIALVVRGRRAQLALVFSILPFVIGEFAPLIENQPFPSQSWLAARVGLAALGSAAIGAAAAWLIGQTPPPEPATG
jgi:hypothetical protein